MRFAFIQTHAPPPVISPKCSMRRSEFNSGCLFRNCANDYLSLAMAASRSEGR